MKAADTPLDITVLGDAPEAGQTTAAHIRDLLIDLPHAVLGLATGRTMLPVYAHLRRWFAQGECGFSRCKSFNLDEYCGISPENPSSFASYMRTNLFDHVDMSAGRSHLPDANDPAAYEQLILASGGIDLQLLGIGRNGHIGFNEPGTDKVSRTHIVDLDASTRAANANDFPAPGDVPYQAVTMGIATILDARHIVLLVTGEDKAEALKRAFEGPVDASCPASFLQGHPHLTLICDSAAARLL